MINSCLQRVLMSWHTECQGAAESCSWALGRPIPKRRLLLSKELWDMQSVCTAGVLLEQPFQSRTCSTVLYICSLTCDLKPTNQTHINNKKSKISICLLCIFNQMHCGWMSYMYQIPRCTAVLYYCCIGHADVSVIWKHDKPWSVIKEDF